ncbi:MAG: outer membrane beta-barrel protein [Gammaproteobacteria bacterium]|nr:outer membrane beta-barrel protein [Gammaproteobacteria bacterium]
MERKLILLSSTLCFAAISTSVQAQDDIQPGFYPGLGLSLASDDNIYRAETAAISDTYYLLNPSLLYKTEFGKHGLDVSYAGSYGYYQDVSGDNYTDHNANADLKLDLTPKFNVDLQVGYTDAHEPRGTSGTDLVVSPTPNLWNESRVFGEVLYGRRTNKGQFSLSYESLQTGFTNNSQDERDRNVNNIMGKFFYNYSSKTSFLFETELATVDYVSATAPVNLDSSVSHNFIGAKWEATAKTTGEIKVGSINKDLKDATLDDFSGNGFDINISWKPKTYSTVQLTASRYTRESATATDSFYVSDVYNLAFRHAFTERVEMNANITPGTDTYSGTREDSLMGIGVGVNYKLNRLLDLGARYISSTRRSNVAGADFDSTVVMLTVSTRANR